MLQRHMKNTQGVKEKSSDCLICFFQHIFSLIRNINSVCAIKINPPEEEKKQKIR